MASLHRAGADRGLLQVGAKDRFTFRLGALQMLLDPTPGLRVSEVALDGARGAAGTMTLSKTGRTLLVDVDVPRRLYLAKAETARAWLHGKIEILPLLDVTED